MNNALTFFILSSISFSAFAQSVVINRVFKGAGSDGQYDAIELLVVEDHIDMRNWILKDYANNARTGVDGDWGAKLRFKDKALWKNLRSGTTIVIRKGDANGQNPSPDPLYQEDTNASDFTIDISAHNKTLLRPLASPNVANPPTYSHKDLILGGTELVLLRWDDGFGEGMGSANAVHAFAYGDLSSSAHFAGIASPKLHHTSGPVAGGYAYAKLANKNITDYATIAGTSANPKPPIYTPPANNNESLAQKLKNNSTLVKTIINENIRYNYPGVKEVYITYKTASDANMTLYILDIDLTDPKLSIEVGTQNDKFVANGTQTVLDMVSAKNANVFEKHVIAGINGDYFDFSTGIANASIIKDGTIVRDYMSAGYKFFGQLDNKTYKIGEQPEYIKLKHKFQELIGGRYPLILNGTIINSTDGAIAPRTAIGLINEKRAIMMVADGRQAHSVGYSLPQLAEAMKALGAKDAVNLDGGGSSTFVIRESNGNSVIKNAPSDGSPRKVSNALFLMRKTD
ncbi:hypothetical protein BCY91_11135 [Pelobium manganitolerans]|uniref:Phosphodiester glycosidase domain-containing protein n=1 Tax=Pelobium manganitolerans TaxID=1842495 RepID=A0A419S241_9SPHI|nr:phosphodiester glycosidase family protein [Pelobium manganitolerans]RKD12796.1 hypothetical protein BCY91_11135 [Pelobium manganitolerans]